MTTFRVPRREISARVITEGGQEIQGKLFAALEGQFGEPGLLIDRLNDDTEPFLPVVTDDDTVLVNTQRIVMIRVAADAAAGMSDLEGDPVGLRLHLLDGLALTGHVHIDLPPENRRVLDYLNHLSRFFAVTTPTGICAVNSRHVVSAREAS